MACPGKNIYTQGLIVLTTLLIFACGGGGGSAPVDSGSPVNDGAGESSNDNGESANDSSGGESEGSGTGSGNVSAEPVDQAGGGSTEEPLATDADANAIFRVARQSEIDAENLKLISIADAQIDSAGHLVIDTSYNHPDPTDTFPDRTTSGSMVWAGTVKAPRALIRVGDAIGNQPPNIRFGESIAVSLGENGEVALIAETRGLKEIQVYAVSDASGVKSYLEEGETFTGPDGEDFTIGSIEHVQHSSVGSLVYLSGAGTFNSAVMLINKEQRSIEAVVGYRSEGAPLLEGGCRFTIPRERYDEIPQFTISPGGVMAFGAQPFSQGTASCPATAIVRKADDGYESLVSSGDVVPGTTASTFQSVSLHSIARDNSIVFEALINTPTGVEGGDNRLSWWVVSTDNTMRLIALAGEEVQLGESAARTLPFDYDSYQVVYENGLAAMNVKFDLQTQAVLFGAPHEGVQPHAAIPAPGAAALKSIASSLDTGFGAFEDSVYFDDLSVPVLSSDGRVGFSATLVDAVSEEDVYYAVWEQALEGELSVRVDTDTTVNVDNTLNTVLNLSSPIRRTGPGTQKLLQHLDDGGLVFTAEFNDGGQYSDEPGIAYLKPDTP